RGATLVDLLDELGETYGHFASGQVSVRVEDLAVIGNVMLALRSLPPTHIAGRSITSAEDLLQAAPGQRSGDGRRERLGDGSRV
ncbi:hypothetical protein, partial [Paraburkholderia sp. SIMBA_053]|uniref:hypothetical protein n=1 Tax=Paraburkholderia sp. SIMBA_053 TaxID=3085794 RepID=UPI00397B093D